MPPKTSSTEPGGMSNIVTEVPTFDLVPSDEGFKQAFDVSCRSIAGEHQANSLQVTPNLLRTTHPRFKYNLSASADPIVEESHRRARSAAP